MSDYILALDPSKRSTDTIDFQTALRGKIVGQEEGVQALVDLYQVFRAGLNSPGRPVGDLLFRGPTGSAPTRSSAASSEIRGFPQTVARGHSKSPTCRPGAFNPARTTWYRSTSAWTPSSCPTIFPRSAVWKSIVSVLRLLGSSARM